MSEISKLLRLLVRADKEFKTSAVSVTATATKFASQLTEGYARRGLWVYNNSHSNSGELYYGNADVSENTGYPIKKDVETEIPLSNDCDVYFVAQTGQTGDLRVFEMA